ncbi:hypothetical protein NPIRD3C_1145 [Nitrosopumilus piranensis]|uniref:Uncharacterized protein n=1 Tax=Nitrosopumilus piranensis TaxID=1582439 RepID=A0A0C5CAY8_9ARCH|nr:hypothetical protein NPIRD3C_1145 [Nitrosopumilus piranensis]
MISFLIMLSESYRIYDLKFPSENYTSLFTL